MRLVERRKPISQTAITLAVIFWGLVVVAIVMEGVPTFQKHGPEAGPGLVRRIVDPGKYYWITGVYAAVAAGATCSAFFRFPWVTYGHILLLFLAGILALLGSLLYTILTSG